MNARISMPAYKAKKRAENAFGNRWHEYEQRKRGWLRTHPGASGEAFRAASKVIAESCGVGV